jgi:hypothetical protein
MWNGEEGSGGDDEADEELRVPLFDEVVSKF